MEGREEEISSLLLDNRFVDWVINPQSPYAEYWLQWIANKPENAALAEEAKNFLLELRKAERDNDLDVSWAIIEQIWKPIEDAVAIDQRAAQQKAGARGRRYAMAAAIMGAIVLTMVIIYQQKSNQPATGAKRKIAHVSNDLVRYNGNDKNELFFLPDGSKVTLAKGARIAYNRLMNGRKRNVELTGDAFFEVSKDPEKPFLIYTKNIIIKVLGTSFLIKATAGNEIVHVKTGKVAVYLKGQNIKGEPAKILLPGQVCAYSGAKGELITTKRLAPAAIEMKTGSNGEYDFDEVPLDQVFKTITKMYEMPVYYDSAAFSNCFITISLGDESLEDKLQTITKTIGATFSMSENGISIEGNGCK